MAYRNRSRVIESNRFENLTVEGWVREVQEGASALMPVKLGAAPFTSREFILSTSVIHLFLPRSFEQCWTDYKTPLVLGTS